MPIILALVRPRQKDPKFKAGLAYILRLCFNADLPKK